MITSVTLLKSLAEYLAQVTPDNILDGEQVGKDVATIIATIRTSVVVINLKAALKNLLVDVMNSGSNPNFVPSMRERAEILQSMPCPKEYKTSVNRIIGLIQS